jgi:hypothetical protein
MTIQSKPVRGSVKILACNQCGIDFSIFDFEVESDADVAGLYSAGTCGGKKLALIDLNFEEWKAVQSGDLRELPLRFLPLLENDYRLNNILRVDQPILPQAGGSFAEFRKSYKAPSVVYSCPCCGAGEAVERSEMTPADYTKSGGQIMAIEPLALIC